jgi:hypothetical protein
MDLRFDSRIVAAETLRFLQTCQREVPFHLGGGAALAGFHLRHRLSRDADLFFHSREGHREAVQRIPEFARDAGLSIRILRDAGTFVRAEIESLPVPIELDLVHEPATDVAVASPVVEGVVLESLDDLRASKLTCILSRSEPRDLVDLMFLDAAGYPPERDLPLAARKDTGIDPAILAWLLKEFPVQPLPVMLAPLDSAGLRQFRDELAERMRRVSVP